MAIPIFALLLMILPSCFSQEVAAAHQGSPEAAVSSLGDQPTLLTRLLYGDLAPITNQEVCWSVGLRKSLPNGSRAWGVNGKVRTDEEGRIRIPLGSEVDGWEIPYFTIEPCPEAEAEARLRAAYSAVDLPKQFKSGELDLGDLILVPYGDPRRFRRMDDETLRRAFGESMRGSARSYDRSVGTPSEEILFEMVRRGGQGWEEFIAGQLAEVRKNERESGFRVPGELELLTALRRIQHKSDPLAVVIMPE